MPGGQGGGTVPWFWLLKLAGPCWSWEAPDWGCWRQSLGDRRALVFLPFAPVSRVLAPAESMVGAEGTQRTHVFRGQSRFVQRGHSPGSLSHLRPMEPEEVWKPRAGRIVRSSYSGVSLMTLEPRACEAKAIDFWTARGSLTCWPGWVRTPKPDKGARGPRGPQASCMGWSFQKPVVGRWGRGVLQGPQCSVTYWLLPVKAVDCLPGA